MDKRSLRRLLAGAAVAAALGGTGAPASAQWVRTHEQFYLPAGHNWNFRRNFAAADRLFNAFDYGHAILYEKLYTRPEAPASELEEKEYDFLTRRLLVHPPRLPLEEGAVEIAYVKLAPEAKLMFEWAHILHRQIYDVLADERLSQADRDREVAALLRYYRSRPEVAFSSVPKNMELMEGQYYSTAFREKYPRFNGLIWAYHWLQVGLYEPLLTGSTPEERQTGVTAAVTRFRQMLENAPENMPRVMPMTAAIAPRFTERYPEAAIIFDNLHSMHDVISDILASPGVPREKKREEILRAAARYRDDTSFVMSVDEWRGMSLAMGAHNMGGPVTGFLEGFPRPTLARGAVMAGTGHGFMSHGASAASGGGAGHAGHGAPSPAGAGAAHRHDTHAANAAPPGARAPDEQARRLAEVHARMMDDPVIRERVSRDPELRRMMDEVHAATPAGPEAAGEARSDAEEAMDFVVRLLSDPEVEARIHRDARLHQLWSDPEVQRRLAELRRARQAPAPPPAPDPHAGHRPR